MRRTHVVLALGCLSITALLFAAARAQEARGGGGPAPPVWEYRVVALTDVVQMDQALKDAKGVTTAVEAKFNDLGREGWELATSLPGAVVFKRARR